MPRLARALAPLAWVYACLVLQAELCLRAGAEPRLKPVSFGEPFSGVADTRPASAANHASYQDIRRMPHAYLVRYIFENFNRDELKASATFDDKVVADSIREFGFHSEDFDALDDWYKGAQASAVERAKRASITGRLTAPTRPQLDAKLRLAAEHNAQVQSQLEATLNALAAEYGRRRQDLYAKAGFRYKSARVVEVNIPALVARSAPRVAPLALDFARIVRQRGYGTDDLVGAVTSMAQVGMRYEDVGMQDGTRTTGGVLPPLKALVMGQGDCDTKTAVMASILKNWPNLRMVGLEIPDHYLMAYQRIPRSGDAYIEYQGLPYVMLEAAGPAWLAPGAVGEYTQGFISSGHEFDIQPL